MERDIIIAYDFTDGEIRYDNFKDEIYKYFEGKSKKPEDWLTNTTLILATKRLDKVDTLKDNFFKKIQDYNFKLDKFIIAEINSYSHL